MARAQGARSQLAAAFETTYGTAPASGYFRMPFASASLGAEQPLLTSELLGYGRDPLAPIKDAVTADGDVVVPIDAEAFGFWLKAAFGPPVTTGTTNKTHTYKSGGWTLPSMAIEVAMPEIPRFAMYTGCVLDQISWQMQRSGLLTATAKLIAQGENVATTTAAGIADLPENAGDEQSALVFAKALGRIAITDWEGVGDDAGKPVDVSPDGVDALLDVWPLFEAFQTEYVAGGLLLDQEKNVSSPLPSGSSVGAMDIAKPVSAPVKTARKS